MLNFVDVCKFAASNKFRWLSASSLPCIDYLASNVVPSISDGAFGAAGVSGLNRVGEDDTMMFNTCGLTLSMHLHSYELPSSTCHRGDERVEPGHGEEHNARDNTRLYNDTMRENSTELGELIVRASTQQKLWIVECSADCNFGNMDKLARIDEREEERRK